MISFLKKTMIVQSFQSLKGNTRIAVIFEPLWGIPYILYNVYLSLYMKSLGITDQQLGYLIAVNYGAGIFFSLFSGWITDALGRRKTTLIFDLVCWPGSILIYMLARNFWIFALGALFNSVLRIVAVSWNLMVVEDADREQQVTAYNWLNIINISMGMISPLAGLLILHCGLFNAEQILLGFALLSMLIMIIVRHFYFTETKVGQEILQERQGRRGIIPVKRDLFQGVFGLLKGKPAVAMTLSVVILFNTYVPIGALSSLYFAPYFTEALQLEKSAISVLSGISSAVLFLVFVLVVPSISNGNRIFFMIAGIALQIISLGAFMVIPVSNLGWALVSVCVFAVGFGIAKPFLDSYLAEMTDGKERTGIYALNNIITSFFCAGMGVGSGYLYNWRPTLIYTVSIIILTGCTVILFYLGRIMQEKT